MPDNNEDAIDETHRSLGRFRFLAYVPGLLFLRRPRPRLRPGQVIRLFPLIRLRSNAGRNWITPRKAMRRGDSRDRAGVSVWGVLSASLSDAETRRVSLCLTDMQVSSIVDDFLADAKQVSGGILSGLLLRLLFLGRCMRIVRSIMRACRLVERSPGSLLHAGCRRFRSRLRGVIQQDAVFAIPKASDVAHVRENRAALEVLLSAEEFDLIDGEFRPPRGKRALEML